MSLASGIFSTVLLDVDITQPADKFPVKNRMFKNWISTHGVGYSLLLLLIAKFLIQYFPFSSHFFDKLGEPAKGVKFTFYERCFVGYFVQMSANLFNIFRLLSK